MEWIGEFWWGFEVVGGEVGVVEESCSHADRTMEVSRRFEKDEMSISANILRNLRTTEPPHVLAFPNGRVATQPFGDRAARL